MCVLVVDNKIVMTVRNKEPQKGKLDLPGGFVDPGENAEEALRRELKEELDLTLSSFIYLGTAVNSYEYLNISYPTCDIIFTVRLRKEPEILDKAEIESLLLVEPATVTREQLAFPSVYEAICLFNANGTGELFES